MTNTLDQKAEGVAVNLMQVGTCIEVTASFQLIPALTAEEYAALRDDIAVRGVLVPIIVDQHGRLIDGHHRRRAARELGLDCPTVIRAVASDHEALDLAVTLNATRRHLSREQRRELIHAEIARRPEDSDRAIARRVGCSPSTVGAVRGQGTSGPSGPKVSKLDTSPGSPPVDGPRRHHQEAEIDKALADLDGVLQAALNAGMTPQHVVGLLLGMQRDWRRSSDVDPEVITAVERCMVQPRIDMLLDLTEPAMAGGDR